MRLNTILGAGILAVCIVLTGCGGSSHVVPPPSQTPEYIYVANQGDNSVSAFQIDTSGQLHQIAGSPFKISFSPLSLISDPKSRFLLIGMTSGFVPVGITSSHTLTLTSTQVPAGFTVMDPLGRFFFDTDGDMTLTTPIHVYSITSGLSFPEIAGSPFEPGIRPVTVDPAGKFLFGFDSTIATLQIGTSGTLIARSSVTVPYDPVYGYVDTSGSYLYVQGINSSSGMDTHVYKINSTGAVTETANETNLSSTFIAFSPSGNFVLAISCGASCELDTLSIDNKTGEINTSPTSRYPEQWSGFPTLDSAGIHLFAVSRGQDCSAPGSLTVFNVSTSGQLEPTGTTADTGPCPVGVAVTQ